MKVQFKDESIEMVVNGEFDHRNCFVGTLEKVKSYNPHGLASIYMSQRVGRKLELRPVPLGVKYDTDKAREYPDQFVWKSEWWYFDWVREVKQ